MRAPPDCVNGSLEEELAEAQELEKENLKLRGSPLPTNTTATSLSDDLDATAQSEIARIASLMASLKEVEDEHEALMALKLQRDREQQQPTSESSTNSGTSSDGSTSASAAPPAPAAKAFDTSDRKFSQISVKAITSLEGYENQMQGLADELSALEELIANAAVQSECTKAKSRLAQMNGDLEKLQFVKIDSIITAELTSGNAEAKALRKDLNRRCEQMQTQVVTAVKSIELLPKPAAQAVQQAVDVKEEGTKDKGNRAEQQRQLDELLALLADGVEVKKHGRRGQPHKRTLFVSGASPYKHIYWQKPR